MNDGREPDDWTPELEARLERNLYAALALRQLQSINEYISAVQIGVTMTSIGIGALGEPALAQILKGALGDTLSHGVAVVIAVATASSARRAAASASSSTVEAKPIAPL